MRSDTYGEDNGTISIETKSRDILVGGKYRMIVTYTAGPKGVEKGGVLRFKLPGLLVKNFREWAPVTCSDPEVTLAFSNTVPVVNGKQGAEFFTIDYLYVTIQDKKLAPGETVAVSYGRGLQHKYSWALESAMPWKVEVATDLDGTRSAPHSGFALVKDAPVLNFVSARAVRLEVTIPSSIVAGEPFETVVRARDRFQNIAAGYRGTVELQIGSEANDRVIEIYTFKAEDEGIHVFGDTVFDSTGVYRVEVKDTGCGFWARSNPGRVTVEKPTVQLFWGDTHTHSRISADTAAMNDLIATPEQDYDYARYKADLDFCMVTDHSQDMSDEDWQETQAAAAGCYEPGAFVTFTAIESTHRPMRKEGGDKNLYYFRDDDPYTNKGGIEDVYAFLKTCKGKTMSIQHMHAGTSWGKHDPDLERVVEVYAHWGCGVSPDSQPPMLDGQGSPEKYYNYALENGIKVGAIASADHSCGHPGDDFWWKLGPYQGGLAAVYGAELTREGIWDGLWNRHCYGTTRARILLEFEINGHVMGEEFECDADERKLKIGAYGTVAIEKVDIIKNDTVLHSVAGDSALDVTFDLTDNETGRDTDYYYVHVLQVDGEQAWSSPVWVINALPPSVV